MKVSSIDFFGVIVTYRVEARKAGPTVFLSLRSSDGVHIDGAGRVCYEHKGHIFRAPDAHWFPSASGAPLIPTQKRDVRYGKSLLRICRWAR